MLSLYEFNNNIANEKDPQQLTYVNIFQLSLFLTFKSNEFLSKLFPSSTEPTRIVDSHQSSKTHQFSPNVIVVAEQVRQKKECIAAVKRMLSYVFI
jgi:hypothetical protein